MLRYNSRSSRLEVFRHAVSEIRSYPTAAATDIEFRVVYILGVRLIPNVSTVTQSQYVLTYN